MYLNRTLKQTYKLYVTTYIGQPSFLNFLIESTHYFLKEIS